MINLFKIMKVNIHKKRYYKKQNSSVKSSYVNINTVIGEGVRIAKNTIIEDRCEIGAYTYINTRQGMHPVYINSYTKIGKFCSIGANTMIGLGNHPTDRFTTHPISYDIFYFNGNKEAGIDKVDMNGNVLIGNDVWIGSGVIILSNIKIGDGAIIGAGSVVTKDVEPYSIVAGIPAKVIRKRFGDEVIEKIKNTDIMWWDKDINFIKEKIKVGSSIDIFLN